MRSVKKTREQIQYYEDFKNRTEGDLHRASVQGQLFTGDRRQLRKARIRGNDNEPVICSGSYIFFTSIDATTLQAGAFVYVRYGSDLVVRRVIRKEVRPDGIYVALKAEGSSRADPPVKATNIVGLIREVEYQGNRYDPTRESWARRLRNRFTEYGTVSVGTKVLRTLPFFLPASMRPGDSEGTSSL